MGTIRAGGAAPVVGVALGACFLGLTVAQTGCEPGPPRTAVHDEVLLSPPAASLSGRPLPPSSSPSAATSAASAATRSRSVTTMLLHAVELALAMEDAGCPTLEDLVSRKLIDFAPSDGWGRAPTVVCDDEAARVCSLGADGQIGTEDDICAVSAR